jgi:hypothetical protein
MGFPASRQALLALFLSDASVQAPSLWVTFLPCHVMESEEIQMLLKKLRIYLKLYDVLQLPKIVSSE